MEAAAVRDVRVVPPGSPHGRVQAKAVHRVPRHRQLDSGAPTRCAPTTPSCRSRAVTRRSSARPATTAGNNKPPSKGSTCAGCHTPIHVAKFGSRCEGCHASIKWVGLPESVGRDNHGKTRYPLEAKHTTIACAACHPKPGREAQRYRSLAFDTCAACHADVHKGEFSRAQRAASARSATRCTGFTPTTFGAHRSTRPRRSSSTASTPRRRAASATPARVRALSFAVAEAGVRRLPRTTRTATQFASRDGARAAAPPATPRSTGTSRTSITRSGRCVGAHARTRVRGVPRRAEGRRRARGVPRDPARLRGLPRRRPRRAVPGQPSPRRRARAATSRKFQIAGDVRPQTTTGYPLDGKHAPVACAKCHPSTRRCATARRRCAGASAIASARTATRTRTRRPREVDASRSLLGLALGVRHRDRRAERRPAEASTSSRRRPRRRARRRLAPRSVDDERRSAAARHAARRLPHLRPIGAATPAAPARRRPPAPLAGPAAGIAPPAPTPPPRVAPPASTPKLAMRPRAKRTAASSTTWTARRATPRRAGSSRRPPARAGSITTAPGSRCAPHTPRRTCGRCHTGKAKPAQHLRGLPSRSAPGPQRRHVRRVPHGDRVGGHQHARAAPAHPDAADRPPRHARLQRVPQAPGRARVQRRPDRLLRVPPRAATTTPRVAPDARRLGRHAAVLARLRRAATRRPRGRPAFADPNAPRTRTRDGAHRRARRVLRADQREPPHHRVHRCHADARRTKLVRCDGCHQDVALRQQHRDRDRAARRGACLRCHPRGAAR